MLRTYVALLVVTLVPCGVGAACGGNDNGVRACTAGADCASGVCLPSGLCAALADDTTVSGDASADVLFPDGVAQDSGPTDATGDTAGPTDTAAPQDTAVAADSDTAAGLCHPNHDGVVPRAEAPFAAGYSANFRTTTAVTGFDTAPDCTSGTCVWDLVTLAGTTADTVADTLDPAGAWWASEPAFAHATYTARLGEFNVSYLSYEICAQTQYGIYQVTDDALLLLGVVSQAESDGTELVYDPPLPIVKFPLAKGDHWTVDTTATGPLCNSWVDYAIAQTATTTVDAEGTVQTPYGDFTDVLRVNTVLARHLGVGVLATSVRTQTYVAECFTSIAIITSAEGGDAEVDGEIRAVAEVRRLANLP